MEIFGRENFDDSINISPCQKLLHTVTDVLSSHDVFTSLPMGTAIVMNANKATTAVNFIQVDVYNHFKTSQFTELHMCTTI